ncbi:sensor histidine kinase [Natronoflexus pectinivorans]|uniref:histidine kinase n=1 Tax=Natronoflexus pectinivorans TaxID=682526 RepID=A0A4R2GFI3_9BACT|nr:HAMP domain-containing sensor histidine kinase [Natronoflexus pectinivorans]TCO06947.1 phospho-acceptor domain-containing protein [Natronoflexus pectinivorans]
MFNWIKISYSQFIRILKRAIAWESNPKNLSLYLLKQLLLVSIMLCLACIFGNHMIGIDQVVTNHLIFVGAWLSAAYILIRSFNFTHLGIILFLATMFYLLNMLWFLNGGSYGPTILIFQIFFGLVIFTISNKIALIVASVFAVNIAFLFWIEYNHPHLISGYTGHEQRFWDIAMVTFLFFFGGLPLLAFGKRYFQKEKERAEQSERIKTAFIANMSHEIRTPMNAIIGFTELLETNDVTKEEKKEFAGIIKENGDILLHLINNIMDISKLDARLVEVKYSEIDVEALIDKLYKAYHPLVGEGIRLTTMIHPNQSRIYIESDYLLLYQVFSNILNNAIKHTEKGEIKFGLILNEKLTFFVSDTGSGIPPEKQEFIFQRFSQLRPNSPINKNGVGLGLSICKSIMDLLGGSIHLQSDGKSGTTFYFNLPLDVIVFKNIRWWDKNLTGV